MIHTNRLALTIAASLLFACGDTNKPAPLPNEREIIEVSMPAGDVSVGAKSVFRLKGSGFESSVQSLCCTFDATSVGVWIEGNQVSSGQRYSLAVNDRTFVIECCPLSAGEATVELKIEDGGTVTTKKLTINAAAKVYDVQLKNIPSPFYVGHRRAVDLSIVDPERPNIQNVKYEVGARVVKGKGVIHIAGEEDPVWCDTIPGYEPFTAEVRNAKWMIMYTGMEVGENQLEFTITDPEKGTSSTSVVSIPVDSSDFELKPRYDSPQTIERNERYHVYIWIDEKGHSANRYFARINPIQGKVSSIFPAEEGQYGAVNASDSYTIFPEGEGLIKCEIEIRDLYGTIRTLPVEFTVKSDDYDILFDAEEEVSAFAQKVFEFNIAGSSDDQNEYHMRVSLESGEPSAVKLLLNAEEILGRDDFTAVLPHETMYVRFKQGGTYRFKFEFKDKWSEPKERYLTFRVKENALAVDLGAEHQSTVLGSIDRTTAAWTAKLSIADPTAGVRWQGTTVKSDLIQGKGELRVNGCVITSGDILVFDRSECTLDFTPSATGTHTLTFLFSLTDGRTVTKTVTVDASYSPVNLYLTCPSGPLYDGQTREISFHTTQAGYKGDMEYKFEFIQGQGKITGSDGNELKAGITYPVKQNTPERMTYTAEGYTGPVEIRYTTIGGDGMETRQTAKFTVKPGLNMTVSAPSQVGMGSSADIAVTVSKPGYDGTFKMKYEIQKPYPSYIGNGTIAGISPGQEVEMTGSTQTLKFTPTAEGMIQLALTVTDETGKSVSRAILMNITDTPIKLDLSYPSKIQMGTPAEIKVSATKAGYSGKLNLKYEVLKPSPAYTGSGEIDGIKQEESVEIGADGKTWKFTPATAGQAQLLFTVTDERGKSASQTMDFKIELLPIIVSPSLLETGLFDENILTMTIPEGNPAGNYQLSYVATFNVAGGDVIEVGRIYFENDIMQWYPNESKTVTIGNHQIKFALWNQSEYIHLHFTLIDPNGVSAITTIKVINLDHWSKKNN